VDRLLIVSGISAGCVIDLDISHSALPRWFCARLGEIAG
jgi:hypothetical protein